MAYLYGASVQGIQDFIFKTNKLKEIVGASKLVEDISKDIQGYKADSILVNAAGNIKAIFIDEATTKKIVLEFPKLIMQKAYGITISQAVVQIDGIIPTQENFNELEKKLKIQRNKPSLPLDMSLNIMKLNPKTAKPLINNNDKSTEQKLKAFESIEQDEKYKELSNISNDNKNKLAVIHADGNGLGELILVLKEKLDMELSEFSEKLDKATKKAFKDAKNEKMKIREVILGGDDMTVICDANDALKFTKNFLENFEKETADKDGLNYKLTACAGIAYTNEKYPFHYAVELAETLCGVTKKHAKNLIKDKDAPAPSSLMFHNIQSSNFQSWDKFIKDELTITNDKEKIRFNFGPYYLNQEGQPLINDFLNTVTAYSCDGSPISSLRAWLSELHKSDQYAIDMLNRINEMAKQSSDWNSCIMDKNLEIFNKELSNEKLIIEKDGELKTPIYDVLQILSVTEKE